MVARVRSPNYPWLSIDDAVQRARLLFGKEGKHASPAETAVSHWGYQAKSSGGLKTVAALKAYGLLAADSSGGQRKVQLTDLGLAIVRDEREISPERERLIAEAGFRPKILHELWTRYGAELPSEDTIKHFLVVDREYNPSAVGDIIKVYRAALAHSKYLGPTLERVADDDDDESDGEVPDDGSAVPDLPKGGKVKMRQDTFTLDEGIVTIQWPERLSPASYADLKDWLEIIGRKIERGVPKDDDGKT